MGDYPFAVSSGNPYGVQYADQLPGDQAGLTGATGITGLLAAMANRNAARVDIPVLGDSITEGQGATSFSSIWVQQANRAIRDAYPTTANGNAGGLGFIPVTVTGETTYDWPVTAAGAVGPQDIGPVRQAANVSAAASFTWTAPAGTTSVQVMYFDSSVAGTFSYQVGAGAATDVASANTGIDRLTASIPITAGEVLTIAWVSGNVFIDGIVHYAGDEASGITFHECGHWGWNTPNWTAAEEFGINWQQVYANGFPGVAAVGIMLGVNDARVASGNETAAQFQAALTTLITQVRTSTAALASIPVLLIITYTVDDPLNQPWPSYAAAIRNVAAAVSGVKVIDLNYRMPADTDTGGLYADNLHPSDLGAALIGEIAAAGIRIA